MSLHHLDESVQTLSSRYKYAHLKTDWAPQIMHRNIAIILWQLYYSKISFVVLMFPGNFEIFNLLCCKFPSKTCATVSCKKVRTKFSLADKWWVCLSLSQLEHLSFSFLLKHSLISGCGSLSRAVTSNSNSAVRIQPMAKNHIKYLLSTLLKRQK